MDTRNEENIGSVKSVFIMMIVVQIIHFKYERETGKNRVGTKKKGRTRELEKQIKNAVDRV